MLVLTRRVGEQIRIGDSIVVTLLKSNGRRARIGVQAPAHMPIYRQEVFEFMDRSKATACWDDTPPQVSYG